MPHRSRDCDSGSLNSRWITFDSTHPTGMDESSPARPACSKICYSC